MRQDHGQPIRSFVAKVKDKAQVRSFTKTCTGPQCNQQADFTDDIVKYVVVSGVADEDIKKDVLGHADLDTRSLNATISLIENKEMTARAMSSVATGDFNVALHQQETQQNGTPKDTDTKFQTKTNCKTCNKMILKFKLRRGKIREFTHCINCWKKIHVSSKVNPNSNANNTGAIFDVLGAINGHTSASHVIKNDSRKNNLQLS